MNRFFFEAKIENESKKVSNGLAGKPDLKSWPLEFRLRGGGRVIIRPLTEADAEAACEMFPKTHEESDFLLHFPGEFDLSVEQEREFIRERREKDNAILLTAELDGRLVAFAGAESSTFKRQQHHAELGVTVVKEFWRMGLGRKLTECIIAWARHRGLHKLYLRVYEDNVRAVTLYESLGFTEEGRLKDDVLRADGRYTDVIVMAKYFPSEKR